MFDCSDVADEVTNPPDAGTDPRITGDNVRCIQGTDGLGSILIVGVVHDHPASTYRVAHLIETFSPEILAVELPPLAMPLFREYAKDDYTPPRMGGEMSMALQAFGDGRTVGIDAPNLPYFRRLVERLLDERVSFDLLGVLLSNLAGGSFQALACRVSAVLATTTPLRLRVYRVFEHESSFLDSPSAQAEDEASHISRERGLLNAVKIPRGMQLIESVREESMADRLRDLRVDGDVVAIVGRNHLEGLTSQ
ncbi:MAG: hypothetical protein ACOCUO_02330, partial [archaeon]